MDGMGKMDVRELKKFRDDLMKLQDQEEFLESCVKELAARLLALVIRRTPVGKTQKETVDVTDAEGNAVVYKKGKNKGKTKQKTETVRQGGTLRRGWISETQTDAENGKGLPQASEILEYANGLKVSRAGEMLTIEIINPVEYASYVEYGHRQQAGRYVPALGKRLKQGWVKGQFMMSISEQELERMTPQILEKKIRTYFERCMK